MPQMNRRDMGSMVRATAIALARATETPRPTATSTRRPTRTPEPTRTLKATHTPGPTETPGPTSTRPALVPHDPPPMDKFPPRQPGPGGSKLGLHVMRNNSPDILEFVRVTKPVLVKGVDDLGWLLEVKLASPSTITVGRVTVDSQDIEGDPVEAARDMVKEQLDAYDSNRYGVDYWEGWNEPILRTPDDMRWYAAFEAERVRALASHGLRAAVGTFSTGVPEADTFPLFLPAIEAAKQYGGVFAVHEYSAPTMQEGVGVPLPGFAPAPHRGVLTLRYRWWYDQFLKPAGLIIPLVITEAGVDGGIPNRPGPDGLGWRDFTDYWRQQGLGDNGAQVYLDQLAWYDRETRQDPYVLGFAVFTAGGPDGQWASFEITDELPLLARYLVSQ